MSDTQIMNFEKRPGILSSYARIVFVRRKGLKQGVSLPGLSARLNNFTVDPDALKRYVDICGLQEHESLPHLYPHVIASPIYMALLTDRSFPISLIGCLHMRNHIVQYRPVPVHEPFNIEVSIGTSRIVKPGFEFDFTITLSSGKGEVLWKSISTWLKRGKFGKEFVESPKADLLEPIPDAETYRELYIPKNLGKRYARITGDYNPIHVSRIAAPLFGLKRDIAHAMWACAQSMAVLPALSEGAPIRSDFAFKGPLFLDNPSRVTLKKIDKGYRFDYFCADNPRPSIQGKITEVSSDEEP